MPRLVVEVVGPLQAAGDGPGSLWGLTLTVADLDVDPTRGDVHAHRELGLRVHDRIRRELADEQARLVDVEDWPDLSPGARNAWLARFSCQRRSTLCSSHARIAGYAGRDNGIVSSQ